MVRRSWGIVLLSFAAGAVAALLVSSATTPKPKEPPARSADAKGTNDEALVSANANLVAAVHECDRRLQQLGEPPVRRTASSADTAEPTSGREPKSFRERALGRKELTKMDWERMAHAGAVRAQVPCLHETPWRPSQPVIDRLGLSRDDVDLLARAYVRSNERVSERILALCERALGSAAGARKVGAKACIDVIQNDAKKTDPAAARDALARVADVHAGKRSRASDPTRLAPLEQLALVLTDEGPAFEAELAEALGRDDARRLATAPELCVDRLILSAEAAAHPRADEAR